VPGCFVTASIAALRMDETRSMQILQRIRAGRRAFHSVSTYSFTLATRAL